MVNPGGNHQTIFLVHRLDRGNRHRQREEGSETFMSFFMIFCPTILCWNFRTIYGGWEPSRNRAVVPPETLTILKLLRNPGIDSASL
jgi:hypothetical protein